MAREGVEDQKTLLKRGRQLRGAGKRREAIHIYEQALSSSPCAVEILLPLAEMRRDERSFDVADGLYRRALEVAPGSSVVLAAYAAFQLLREDIQEALQLATQAVSRDEASADAHFVQGQALAHLDRYPDACEAFGRALELRPDWDEARRELIAARRGGASRKIANLESMRWPKQQSLYSDFERLVRERLLPGVPHAPIVNLQTRVSALGSCFATNVARRLRARGLETFFKPIGEDVNSTFANRYLLDWIVDGVTSEQTAELETIYGAEERSDFLNHFRRTDLFVFTLGVAPVFFHRETGRFLQAHGGRVERRRLPQIAEFRMTGVGENAENLKCIIGRLRSLSPDCRIVLTVSPVPLLIGYDLGSAVMADTLSKATMRLTVAEVMNETSPGVYYWPSFEIVRWLGAYLPQDRAAFALEDGNTRHVSHWLVDLIVKLFLDHFEDGTLRRNAAGA